MINAVVASCVSQEPFFSWSRCESCNGIAGDRYDVTYRETLDGEIETAAVCPDCMVDLCG